MLSLNRLRSSLSIFCHSTVTSTFSPINNNNNKLFCCCRSSSSSSLKQIQTDPLAFLRKMPKEPIAAREMKKQRQLKSQSSKLLNNVPSLISIGVLGNAAPGSPKAIFVTTDHHSYLFNCSEGTQRLAQEHGYRLAKCANIFITQTRWSNIGGLVGMGLSLQTIGVPKLNLHGPDNLLLLLEHTAQFGVTADLEVEQANHKNEDFFVDPCMKVDYVRLSSSSSSSSPSPSSSIKPQPNENGSEHKKQKRYDRTVLCYVCTLHDKPGKLNLQKCIDLKVPRGPLLGQLKAGKDIILADGQRVSQRDVCDEDEKGECFLIIDCPTQAYIDSMIVDSKLAHAMISNSVACVVHFAPVQVVQNDRYQKWINQFDSSVHHLFLNETNCNLAYLDTCKMQYKLGQIDNQLFPPLQVNTCPVNQNASTRLINPPTNFEFVMRPRNKKVTHIDPLQWNTKEYDQELKTVEGLEQAIQKYRQDTKEISAQSRPYPQVITFGTGSAVPGKLRNASCILLNMSATSSMIMDCGEGSLGQMLRFYGPDRFQQIIRNVKSVFISHLHADHHIGLVSILQYRQQYAASDSPPIVLYAPESVYTFLMKMDQDYESLAHLIQYRDNPRFGIHEVSQEYLERSDLQKVSLAKVKHCRQSCGIAVETIPDEQGRSYKIVYSGDAMRTDTLLEIGQNCDLLIHEATLDDIYALDALAKHHSTTSEAIQVGKDMKAGHTLLTHFSQRYSKLPFITADFDEKIGIAFDNMCLRLSDLDKMHHLVEVMKVLFADEFDQLRRRNEQKTKQEKLLQCMLQQKEQQQQLNL